MLMQSLQLTPGQTVAETIEQVAEYNVGYLVMEGAFANGHHLQTSTSFRPFLSTSMGDEENDIVEMHPIVAAMPCAIAKQ
jgi:hypothetical protein